MLWLLLIAGVIVLGLWLLKRPHRYWIDKGVPQGKPVLMVGDSWGIVSQKQSFTEMSQWIYNMCPNTRYSGFYQFLLPTIVLRDPDLIKQITVKDFDHFTDRRSFIPEDIDPLWAKNLVALTGKKWRDMRANLSPAFTSSKMKFMFSLIAKSGEQFAHYFLKKNEDIITIEMKDAFTRFTNDVIANTAFGIECDSLNERNNEFYVMGKEVTNFSTFWKNMKIIAFMMVPSVAKFFKLTLFGSEINNFFKRIVTSNIESREKHGIVRPDMIHLLLEARKHGLKHEETQEDTSFAVVEESAIGRQSGSEKAEITDQDITSQALIFFFAGFETVSSVMCFMSYELAINPDIQDRLIQEIDDTREACKGQLTYEALNGMKYLDMVISESLRKWPNGVIADRVCTKPYTIEPTRPGEVPVDLEKGALLWLPIYAIHRDPQYWPEPERFDPERFSDENKGNINPYTYMPFGAGPRNCIGSRFALLEMKILFYHILSHFKIVPVEKTQIPLVLSKKQVNMTAEDGFWLGLKRRS